MPYYLVRYIDSMSFSALYAKWLEMPTPLGTRCVLPPSRPLTPWQHTSSSSEKSDIEPMEPMSESDHDICPWSIIRVRSELTQNCINAISPISRAFNCQNYHEPLRSVDTCTLYAQGFVYSWCFCSVMFGRTRIYARMR